MSGARQLGGRGAQGGSRPACCGKILMLDHILKKGTDVDVSLQELVSNAFILYGKTEKGKGT